MPTRASLAALAAVLALPACATARPERTPAPTPPTAQSTTQRTTQPPSTSPPTTPTTTAAPPTTPAPILSRAERALAGMSLAQRVGQLFMVDCPSSGVIQATVNAITRFHVGSVILDGTSRLSRDQTAAITAQLQQQAPRGLGLFIATDQEGGLVQRMQGPGFSSIPSAVAQGGLAPSVLRAEAQQWGAELRAAGVNVDLAPVLDTVPPDFGGNPPIGDLDREYGRDPATVASHGVAVAQGLAAAHIDATVKHFPGLGRVAGNTDVSSGVLDTVTTRHDRYLAPFAAAIRAGVPFVMMSTAIYTDIDPDRPAAFSPTVVTGMLRQDLGFTGVIISDDIGIATQVSGYSIGGRAVAFIAAGGDMVLTVDAGQAPQMTAAVLARANADRHFRAQVNAAALVVLRAKQAAGLLR
ncbi:MAG: beta-N-acetylhexosaminidase [Pseudonocardiales bacterium]|nr:beta-N-acetylhexosaminidase [Pseudonocardiales bacterium]